MSQFVSCWSSSGTGLIISHQSIEHYNWAVSSIILSWFDSDKRFYFLSIIHTYIWRIHTWMFSCDYKMREMKWIFIGSNDQFQCHKLVNMKPGIFPIIILMAAVECKSWMSRSRRNWAECESGMQCVPMSHCGQFCELIRYSSSSLHWSIILFIHQRRRTKEHRDPAYAPREHLLC